MGRRGFLELLRSRLRGRAAVCLSIGWTIGVILAVGVTEMAGGLGWHVVAIASGLAGAWVFPIRARVPGSPYWLAERGRHAEAVAVPHSLGAAVPEGSVFVASHEGGRVRAGQPSTRPSTILRTNQSAESSAPRAWLGAGCRSSGRSGSAHRGRRECSTVGGTRRCRCA
ncbi:MFS transporter [Streptomyces sp. NPDC056390]|uniref:MFS transporter n=1 Tax=Streptomyces sp. NPDC056390 TaxID=3345806 RepID=UPI0035DB60B5